MFMFVLNMQCLIDIHHPMFVTYLFTPFHHIHVTFDGKKQTTNVVGNKSVYNEDCNLLFDDSLKKIIEV